MTTQKPKYAVLGNLPDDLTQEISSAVEIHPPTTAVEEIDGLLIHGPTATPDLATLEQHLKAGKILTFHQPTDEHLSHMLKLVGYAPASGIPIVSCYRNAATQSSTVFQTLQTTGGQGFHPGPDDDYGTDTPGAVSLISPAAAPHLTSVQTIIKNGIPPRQGLLPPITGYSGQTWGTLRVVEALDNATLALNDPIFPNKIGDGPCDQNWKYKDAKTGASLAQPGTALMHYSDYYVYWANGNDGTGNGPYYCLIRLDSGYVTAGQAGGRAYVSSGYYSGLFQLYPVNLTIDASTNPNSWAVIPLGTSPGAGQLNSDGTDSQVPVYAPGVTLTFYGNAPGKTNTNWQWNVGKDSSGQTLSINTLQLPGWGIDYAFDNSIVFHQVEDWDTYLYPWQECDWSIFWSAYQNTDNSDCIKRMAPSLSKGRVPFSQVSSWIIQSPSSSSNNGSSPVEPCIIHMLPSVLTDNNPTEAPSGLNTLWQFMAFFAHGPAGCTVKRFHFWFNYFYGCYPPSSSGDTIDLRAIVNHTVSS